MGSIQFAAVVVLAGIIGTFSGSSIVFADDHGNDSTTATRVDVPSLASGVIENGSDEDWFSFSTLMGKTYVLSTALGSLDDSVLTLYDIDGTTQLEFNDDWQGLASQIVWECPADGTYYAAVGGFSSNTGGYTLQIAAVTDLLIHVRDLLSQDKTHQAYTEVQSLLQASPDDPELNLYVGFLRFLEIVETPDARFSGLLDAFGVSIDLIPDASTGATSPLPDTAPSLKEVQEYATDVLLPLLEDTDANLAVVASVTDVFILVPENLGSNAVWFTVDSGDASILKGVVLVLKSMVLALDIYNLDVDANEVDAAFSNDQPGDLLSTYPSLLTANTDSPDRVQGALQSWLAASRTVADGIRFKLDHQSTGGSPLFAIDDHEGIGALDTLTVMDRVLSGLAVVTGGDMNGDGTCDYRDLLLLQSLWHK